MTMPEYAILQSIAVPILIIDTDHTILFANQSFIELCSGTGKENVIGSKCFQISHNCPFPCQETGTDTIPCVHARVFSTGKPIRIVHEHTLPNGNRRLLQITASPLKNSHGKITRIIQILEDITEREKLTATLARQTNELENILNNAPFSISYLDKEMRVLRINPAMERLANISLRQARGRHCYDLWGQYANDEKKSGRERICDPCQIRNVLRDGRKRCFERQVECGRIVRITTAPVRDNRQQIIGVMEIGQDVTDLRQAEQALRQEVGINSLLAELAQSLIKSHSLEKITNMVLRSAQELTSSPVGFVGYLDQDSGHLVCPTFSEKMWKKCRVPECSTVFDKFPGLWGWVLEKGEPVLTNSPAMDRRSTGIPFGHLPVTRFLAVPSRIDSTVTGLIAVANSDDDYTEKDLNVLERLAALFALALQRRSDEDKIRASEARFSNLFNNLGDAAFVLGENGRFLDVNDEAVRRLGYSRKELLSMTPAAVQKSEGTDLVKACWRRTMEFGSSTCEIVQVSRDGQQFPSEVKATRIEMNGRPALLALVRDIRERKKTEEQLRRAKEDWERTFDAIDDIITIQDTDMRILRANRAAGIALNTDPHELTGRYCYELFSSDRELCSACPVYEVLHSRKPHTRILKHEKLQRTYQVSLHPVLDDQKNIVQFVHIAKDITDQQKAQDHLLQSEKMATIAGLAAGVAHEINTPLSAILQSIQVIRQGLSSEQEINREQAAEHGVDLDNLKEYFKSQDIDFFLNGIQTSASNAAKIITNLLEFSRPQKGEVSMANLNELMDSAVELARADYDLKKKYDILNVTIRREYDTELPPVPCVAMEIEQVLLNIIKNAVQALAGQGEKNPSIILRTARTGSTVRIEVEDNGPGMDEEIRGHVFDPFFTTKEVGAGTGLGLYVAYTIISEKHQGKISVESEPDKGARFIIELPLEP
ncbi:PAS domain-containing protein [Desulfolithobacter sp.]